MPLLKHVFIYEEIDKQTGNLISFYIFRTYKITIYLRVRIVALVYNLISVTLIETN